MAFLDSKVMNIVVMTILLSSLVVTGANASENKTEIGELESKVYIGSKPSRYKTNVRLINNLGAGVWIFLHCKSKDDDLGRHWLRPHKDYGFSFNPNFWGTTLFHCRVFWEWPGDIRNYYFDFYKYKRDHDRCSQGADCCWNINPLGPCECLTNKCYDWTYVQDWR